MKKVGRPLAYTKELGDEICELVSDSPLMLEEICAQNPHLPCAKTIYRWRRKNVEFGQKYAIAKQEQIEPLVNTILNKVRDKSHDFYENTDGSKAVNTAAMARLRIEVDAIKWFASKLAPKIYGEKKDAGEVSQSLMQSLIDKL